MSTNELILLYDKLNEAHSLIAQINPDEIFSDKDLIIEPNLRKADLNLYHLLLSLNREIKTRKHKTLMPRNTI